MAGFDISRFVTAILLIYGTIVVVRCEVNSVDKIIDKVNGYKISHDHSKEFDGGVHEKPIIEQPALNPKNDIPNDKVETDIQSSDIVDIFNRIQSRMSKMMDCMMDGMRHQTNYGLAGFPDMMDSRIGKFSGDAKQFFKKQESSSPVDGKTSTVGILGNQPEAPVPQEIKDDGFMYRPVFHRFIIIKKLPLLSFDDDSIDKEAVDSSQSRMKDFFNSFLGSSPDVNEQDGVKIDNGIKMSVAVNDDKPLSSDGVVKESKGKLCDFLTNLAYKSGLKRTTLILLMTAILLCFAWYCIATVLSSRRRKAEQSMKMSAEGDMEYLIPIEEKFLFFAPLDDKEKMNPGDVVQAPSLPIKIKIQDV